MYSAVANIKNQICLSLVIPFAMFCGTSTTPPEIADFDSDSKDTDTVQTDLVQDSATESTHIYDTGAGTDIPEDTGHQELELCDEVAPYYMESGVKWNDYILNDGNDPFTAQGIPCTGDETGGYQTCIHGGLMRMVQVAGYNTCSGLSVSDSLGAFEWTCDASTNPVRMISTRFKPQKNLSDIIDFDSAQWKPLSLLVNHNDTEVLRTPTDCSWWPNPLVVANNGGYLQTESAIYLITNTTTGEYNISADKIALLIHPNAILHGPGNLGDAIQANGVNFLWLEGTVKGTNDETGISLNGVKFSVLQNIRVIGAWWGMMLSSGFSNNKVSELTIADSLTGLVLTGATNNTFENLTIFNNEDAAISLLNGNRNNIFLKTACFSSNKGFYIQSSEDNIFANITATNNGRGISGDGIHIFANADNNLFINAVTANNYGSGIHLEGANNNSFENTASANNGISGAIVAAYSFEESSNNYFTGVVIAGRKSTTKHCYVGNSVQAGLEPYGDGCTINGSSNAAVFNHISLETSFIGKVESDSINLHGDSGSVAYGNVKDWTNFENKLRGWGLEGRTFPSSDHIYQCGQLDLCRIWDWSLVQTDTHLKHVTSDELPIGHDTMQHVWNAASQTACSQIPGATWISNACSISGYEDHDTCIAFGGDWISHKCVSVFLRNTAELLHDGTGNDNGLCESNERCMVTPNIGAYQGHGNVVDADPFLDGTLNNITLVQYETNGY